MKPGETNLITDISGLEVGNAEDHLIKTGTTILIMDKPFVTGVHVMGGAPGTRETDLLEPERLVQKVDSIVLSGGSAFGLSASSTIADLLRQEGRGYQVGNQVVPIVPSAILFDLSNGGNKAWIKNPYEKLATEAYRTRSKSFELGTAGAGTGATTYDLKGGLGSASLVLDNGLKIGALVAVNPFGSVIQNGQSNFWASRFEYNEEYGGLGSAPSFDIFLQDKIFTQMGSKSNTILAIVATNADLNQAQCKSLAISAHDGMARAVYPSHTLVDGDVVFSVSNGDVPVLDNTRDLLALGNAAAICVSRAICRGVFLARSMPNDQLPTFESLLKKSN